MSKTRSRSIFDGKGNLIRILANPRNPDVRQQEYNKLLAEFRAETARKLKNQKSTSSISAVRPGA